jgi:F0F1-type ATP synthase assembly protein I/DNA-directed RNA polymerase subunit RPC12/RpoP
MSEIVRTITLKCVSCGSNLEITGDMENFACGYCGTQQRVERRGGTVALKPLTDAIAKVQVGTDKTAAELAIRRYQDEINALQQSQEKRQERAIRDSNSMDNLVVVGVIIGVIVAIVAGCQNGGAGIVIALITGVIGGVFWLVSREKIEIAQNRDLEYMDAQIETLRSKIREQKKIAES